MRRPSFAPVPPRQAADTGRQARTVPVPTPPACGAGAPPGTPFASHFKPGPHQANPILAWRAVPACTACRAFFMGDHTQTNTRNKSAGDSSAFRGGVPHPRRPRDRAIMRSRSDGTPLMWRAGAESGHPALRESTYRPARVLQRSLPRQILPHPVARRGKRRSRCTQLPGPAHHRHVICKGNNRAGTSPGGGLGSISRKSR
jgi:hypothetical protein